MQLPEENIKTREVTQWQGLHLLHYDLSSCSQKVRILMRELGIQFTSHPINLMRNENRTPWFTGINPNGLVPVLVHDGVVHIESNDIITYLNEHFGDGSLLPVDAGEETDMQTLMDLEDHLHPDLRTVTFTYLAPDPSDHAPKVTADDFGFITRFDAAMQQLNQQLKGRAYLLGERMTLADISWFITLYRLTRAGFPMTNYPLVDAYYRRISARPAFQKEVAAGPLPLRVAGALYRRLNQRFRRSLAADYQRWRSLGPGSPAGG